MEDAGGRSITSYQESNRDRKMKSLERNLLDRLADVGYPLLYFDNKSVNDMSKEELKLLCGWLGCQLLAKESAINISMVQNED